LGNGTAFELGQIKTLSEEVPEVWHTTREGMYPRLDINQL